MGAAAEAVRDLNFTAALDGYLLSLILGAGESAAAGGAWHPEKLNKALEEGGKYVDTSYGAAALCRMAEARKKLGDMEAVRDYCRKAVDKAWNSERMAVEVLLRVYLLMGSEEVSKYCNERLRTDPDSLAANYTMFNLAKIKEDYDEAITYIDKCIALCPPDTPQHTGVYRAEGPDPGASPTRKLPIMRISKRLSASTKVFWRKRRRITTVSY